MPATGRASAALGALLVVPSLDLVVVRNGLYQRFGEVAVRTGERVHATMGPDQWDDNAFLGPIVRSIGDAEP